MTNKLRKQLGLQDPEVFWRKAIEKNFRRRKEQSRHTLETELLTRQTGRTTTVLLQCLEQLKRGKEVILKAQNERAERYMKDKLVQMAFKLKMGDVQERVHIYRRWVRKHYIAEDHPTP